MTFQETSQKPFSSILYPLAPAILASIIFLVFAIDTTQHTMALNDGHLVYGLDDAYIHMSIARNFAEHGVWGVTPYSFSSTTSAPLWTLLLAVVYTLFGVNESTPLILNIFIGILILFEANQLLLRFRVPLIYRLVVLLVLVLFIPFNTLVLSGMEHLLQILFSLLLVKYTLRCLQPSNTPPSRFEYWLLPLVAALATTTRYEGLLMVALVCTLMIMRGRLFYAFVIGAAAGTSIIIYGWIAVANGWSFVPASLVIKSGSLSYLIDASWDARFTFLVVDTFVLTP